MLMICVFPENQLSCSVVGACGVEARHIPAGMRSPWFALLIVRDTTHLGGLQII